MNCPQPRAIATATHMGAVPVPSPLDSIINLFSRKTGLILNYDILSPNDAVEAALKQRSNPFATADMSRLAEIAMRDPVASSKWLANDLGEDSEGRIIESAFHTEEGMKAYLDSFKNGNPYIPMVNTDKVFASERQAQIFAKNLWRLMPLDNDSNETWQDVVRTTINSALVGRSPKIREWLDYMENNLSAEKPITAFTVGMAGYNPQSYAVLRASKRYDLMGKYISKNLWELSNDVMDDIREHPEIALNVDWDGESIRGNYNPQNYQEGLRILRNFPGDGYIRADLDVFKLANNESIETLAEKDGKQLMSYLREAKKRNLLRPNQIAFAKKSVIENSNDETRLAYMSEYGMSWDVFSSLSENGKRQFVKSNGVNNLVRSSEFKEKKELLLRLSI